MDFWSPICIAATIELTRASLPGQLQYFLVFGLLFFLMKFDDKIEEW